MLVIVLNKECPYYIMLFILFVYVMLFKVLDVVVDIGRVAGNKILAGTPTA